MRTDWLLLTPLARLSDLGLLAIRWVTGAFLLYQSYDNVLSAERMQEFVKFLTQFRFIYPEFLAPLSVWCQVIAAIGFILGLLTRWLGLITAFNFTVAVWMVHAAEPFNGWWPALILVFLGGLFATVGPGRYAVDHWLERRSGDDRHRLEAAAAR